MNHPIENIMQSSMEHIKRLADVDTVIGSPLRTEDGSTILPVSKVCLGMLVGGGEYLAVTPAKKSSAEYLSEGGYPFMGASALGMCLTPLAFLAVQNGSVRVLPAKQDCASERLVDLIPQIMETAERLVREYSKSEPCSPEKPEPAECREPRPGRRIEPEYCEGTRVR